ncbi:MAG: PD-(D/E)XK nuclease domain-containing protein [Thermotogota bacterium]
MYNPFSILNFLNKKIFDNYWVESGSPSFIVKYAERHDIQIDKFLGKYVQKSILSTYEIEEAPPVSFLIQAGYLTFKDYKQDEGYLIDYPNKEVRDSFSKLLMLSQYNHDFQEANDIRDEIRQALKNRDFERLFELMRRTFSNIPYTIFEPGKKDDAVETQRAYIERLEAFYHSVILTMLWAAGINVRAEELKYRADGVYCSQNKLPSNSVLGITSDLILEYEQDVYIIELKKQPPEVSLEQIKNKQYSLKYGNRKLYLVGIKIDDENRNVSDYKIEE